MKLQGQVAIVTAAGRGIGKGIGHLSANHGKRGHQPFLSSL